MRIKPAAFPQWLLLTGIIIIPLLAAAWQVDLPRKWQGFRGDSAVYYAMSDSLAHDGDLRYTRKDLIRITREWPEGPQGILLAANETHPEIIHYAKPLLYPLIAAPLVSLFAANGMLMLNTLCFGVLLLCGFLAFPTRSDDPLTIGLWTLAFWGLTVVPAYIFSLTPDIFNCALAMLVMTIWVRWEDRDQGELSVKPLLVAALILGFAAAARPPAGLFIVALLWSLLFRRTAPSREKTTLGIMMKKRLLPALGVIAIFLAGAGLVFFFTRTMTGQMLAHGGFRKRIVGHFPFESSGLTFLNTGNMISTRSTKFVFHWDTLWLNMRYFFFGRFTGLVPYFLPAAVAMVLGLPLFQKNKDGKRRAPVWIICLGMILFHLVYIPTNYHGGSCSIGNRYLISYLPVFFFLVARPPRMKTIFAIVFLTAILTGPIALNPIDSMANYRDISKADRFQRFPVEMTLLNSLPVDDTRHMKTPFKDQRGIGSEEDVFHIYFIDDNQWGQELNGFWVRGDSRATMVLRCYYQPVEIFRFEIRNGGAKNRITVRAGDSVATRKIGPGEPISLDLKPGKPAMFYNLNGDPAYCYTVSISTTGGFTPKFTETGSEDSRYLGCFTEIKINS